MTINDISHAYNELPLEQVHQMYREIELDTVDNYHYDRSLFCLAAEYADAGAVEILLERGGKPGTTDRYGKGPLHYLATSDVRMANYKVTEDAIRRCSLVFLDNKVSHLRKDDDSKTCLHEAAWIGHLGVVQAVGERGGKMDLPNRNGDTALHLCCRCSGSAVSFLESAKKQLEQSRKNAAENSHRIYQERVVDSENHLAKCQQKVEDYFEMAKIFIASGMDPELRNNSGETPLDVLSHHSGDKRIGALLTGTYSEDASDPTAQLHIRTGGMNLWQSIIRKDLDALKANLELGADPNALCDGERDYEGVTPLSMAILCCQPEMVRLLLDSGVDPNVTSADGKTAVAAYLRSGNLRGDKPGEILELLKAAGLDIDASVDEKGSTAICLACEWADHSSGYNNITMPKLVLDAYLDWGCDINRPNNDGVTPLMYLCGCRDHKYENYIITLLEEGAEVDVKDKAGNTPLMYTARNRDNVSRSYADLLFSFGDPLPDAVNNEGKTALEIATDLDNENMVKFLLGKM